MDTDKYFCPNRQCRYYGWRGRGNIRANGRPNGGRWRQLQCTVCNTYFMETWGTPFYRCRMAVETVGQMLKALAEGLDIRAVARVFDLDPNTVHPWLRQAGEHLEALRPHLLQDLELRQVQLDELWALLGRGGRWLAHFGRRARHSCWVWVALDPVSKLLIAYVVGDRSLESAQLLIHGVAQVLAAGCVPLFLSDQWAPYATALLTYFGHWVEIPRRFPRGRPPAPRWMPLPERVYAPVVKQRLKGRVVAVHHGVVYGSRAMVQEMLERTGVGRVINTAFIERLNLSIRQHLAALGRKVLSIAKTPQGVQWQLGLWWGYYNFCLPHQALRVPLPEPLPTKGSGSPKKGQPRSPAMAAGVTDHIWSMEELLLFPVPPWPQPAVAEA